MSEKSPNNIGLVDAIFINRQKSMPREQVQEGIFKEDFGLIGDIKSGSSEKQVVILGLESNKQHSEYSNGLCINRFHETIRIRNIELYRFSVGTKLKIGETIQEISIIGKKCFDECKLVQSGVRCSLSTQTVFTKVIQGGAIKVGDLIQIMI